MKSILLGTAALALTAGVAMADTVRLGTEGAYPPYNFINDKGEVDGFERELGDELCKRAELTCEWVTNDWDSIIPNLTSGNYDAIIAGMSITEGIVENFTLKVVWTPKSRSGDIVWIFLRLRRQSWMSRRSPRPLSFVTNLASLSRESFVTTQRPRMHSCMRRSWRRFWRRSCQST